MEPLVYKIEVYEGPLDLLLALISKNKMNICDIQISIICEQYMDYVRTMEMMDMEVAGEFIQMASELMLIKSKMLLPKEEEDPRDELVRTLMEYKTAKEAAEKLGVLEKEYAGRYEKDSMDIKPDKTVINQMDVDLLSNALARVLMRAAEKEQLAKSRPIESINPIIKKKIVSVPSKVVHLLKRMAKHPVMSFTDLFEDAESRSGIIATFYAILELLKVGRLEIEKDPLDTTNSNVILKLKRGKLEAQDNNG